MTCVLAAAVLAAVLAAPADRMLVDDASGIVTVRLLLELGSAMLAVLVAMVAWHALEQPGPQAPQAAHALIGGFAVVACCSLAEALSHEGMPPFLGPNTAGKAAFFGLAARVAELVALGMVAFDRVLPWSRRGWLAAGGVLAGLLVMWGTRADGLGPLPGGAESALALLTLVLALAFWRTAGRDGLRHHYFYAAACFLLSMAQVFFLADAVPLDARNLFGYLYQLAGYGLVYGAAFTAGIRFPYEDARQSARQLRDSEARLRSLSDHLPNCVVFQLVRTRDGSVRFSLVSEAVERMFGLKAADVLLNHRLLLDRIVAEDQPRLRATVAQSAEHMSVFDLVVRVLRTDGVQRWFRMCSAPRHLEEGGVAWDGVLIDITDERVAAEEVHRNEVLMRTMIDHIPIEIWVRDMAGRIILENETSVRHHGVLLGHTVDEAPTAEEREAWTANNRRALAGEVVQNEVSYLVDGESRSYYNLVAPIRGDGGELQGIVGLNMDLTERKRAEALVHEKEAELARILLHVPGGVSRLDRELRFLFVNQVHADWFGRPADQIIGRPLSDIVSPERYVRMLPFLQRALAGEFVSFENLVKHPSGRVHYRQTSMVPERAGSGEVVGLVVFASDTTERKRMELALQENQQRLAALVEAIPDAVFMKNADGVYLSCNPECERRFGRPSDQIVGRTDLELVDRARADFFRAQDQKVMETGQPAIYEEWLEFGASNARGLFETSKIPIRDADGRITGVLGVSRDITARKRAEQEIERLAFYDPLTGLPNRRLLLDRLQHAQAAGNRSGAHGALLFIDLDNFKDLNDTLGHDMGDKLLQRVATRLLECIRESDTVARFGGDEFVVMAEGLSDTELEATTEAGWIGEKILIALNEPYALDDTEHHSTPSVGIVLFQGAGQSTDELLKRADLAMYQAKAAGRNTLRFFDPEMQAAVSARSALEADLRQGLQRHELLLYFQPVVNERRQLLGAEALVRWQHPLRGMVSPGHFIPLAEQTGLILPLGQWVLKAACEQLVRWAQDPDAEPARWSLSVNVSARQFRHPDFVNQVLQTLRETGADPARLKLELTESLLLQDVEDIIAKMSALKAKGVGFSLDDFGTGYSSLSYLKRLPLDQLKIDQSFVRDVLSDPNDAAIVRTILALARSLDLEVVAEGVETSGQLEFLLRAGCTSFQGYLFGRPQPVEMLGRELSAAPQS